MTAERVNEQRSADDAWDEIERLVNEMAALSRSEVSVSDFFNQLLSRTVQAAAAVGGAVWLRDRAGRFVLEYQIGLERTGLVGEDDFRKTHGRLLDTVLRSGEVKTIPPKSGQAGGHDIENPTEWLLIVQPLVVDGDPLGVIEVFQRPTLHPSVQRGHERLLNVVGGLAEDFYRGRQLRTLRGRIETSDKLQEFARLIHQSLDLRTTAYTIVNEGRRLIGCDRVSIAAVRGSRCELLAISGVDTFNRRANAVRMLEQLAAGVLATGEPLWYRGAPLDIAPEVESILNAYVDEQHVRTLILVPLKDDLSGTPDEGTSTIAVMVVERFDAAEDETLTECLAEVCKHSQLALRNAENYQLASSPLRRLLHTASWPVRDGRRLKTLLALAAIALVGVLLLIIPADLEIKARGELQPLERRQVFAPNDGVVVELKVKHDDDVKAGDELLRLTSRELSLEYQQIQGQNEQAQKRLIAVLSEKHQVMRGEADNAAVLSRLTAQESELQQQLASQERQLAILNQQIEGLTIRSPIDGRVLTWKVEELLNGRPVRQGQAILSVAHTDGPWGLELNVPDDQIGHVLRARRQIGDKQSVSFILATHPDEQQQGIVRKVSSTVSFVNDRLPVVLVTVDFDRESVALLRPGASVVAKIDCGRRSLGFVWFHRLMEAIQARVLF